MSQKSKVLKSQTVSLEVDEDIVRKKLHTFSTVDHVIEAFLKCKRILVVTGAGISVKCGIPDFRSSDGLYNTLDCDEIGIPSAELLFDYEYFKIEPEPFYRYAKMLLPRKDVIPSLCHSFIRTLECRKKLLRNYTQNVDGIEKIAGISTDKAIQCHGSMSSFSCMKCKKRKPLDYVINSIILGNVPTCDGKFCCGVFKPEIVFFGESLPTTFFKALSKDYLKCDMLVVIGTSLKVGGSVSEILKAVRCDIPQVCTDMLLLYALLLILFQ